MARIKTMPSGTRFPPSSVFVSGVGLSCAQAELMVSKKGP